MKPFKLFICADMEGATGIVHRDQLVPEGGDAYRRGCALLTGDVVALIEGAKIAGQLEVVISEGHAHMRNIAIEELPACARLVCGPASWAQKPLCQIAGLDESFDLAFFVGFHSRAGTPGGLLSHTWAGSIVHEIRLDGKPVGETAINAAICGSFGVPVGLVAGADDLVREAHADLGYNVEYVTTKIARGFNLAECWGPQRTRVDLYQAAHRAIGRYCGGDTDGRRPARVPPRGRAVVELDTHRREMADKMALVPGLARVGPRTVRAEGPEAATVFGTLWHGITEAFKEPAAWLA